MGFPTNNVHRRNRRSLGKDQQAGPAPITVTPVGSGSTAVLTFSRAVNVAGPIPLTVASLTYVSQVVNSPTQVTVTMSGAVATHAWTLPTPIPTVSTYQGGMALGGAGTF